MKGIKAVAAFLAAGLVLSATGCAVGSKAKEEMNSAFDSYISKVLSGKSAKKLVDAKEEASYDLSDNEKEILMAVTKNAQYEIKESKVTKDEGSITVEFKYADAKDIAGKVDGIDSATLIKKIEKTDEDDFESEEIEFDLVLDDGSWLVSKKSDSKFKKFLEDIVEGISLTDITRPTTPSSDPSGSGNTGVKVGVSLPTKELWRWAHDGELIKKKLIEYGYDVDLMYSGNNVAEQLSQIDRMIDDGCEILIIAAVEGSSLNSALDKAKQKNIAVIAYDRLIMDTMSVDYYVSFDNYMVGQIQGEYVKAVYDLDNSAGPFNIEFTAGDPGDHNAALFYNGAYDVLKPYIDSGKLVVVSGQTDFDSVATPSWMTANAQARAENIIYTYYSGGKNVDIWLCSNDSTALGVENALAACYTGKYPIITGQDCDIANVKNILKGKQSMSVFKDTRTLAEQAVKMAHQIASGAAVDVNDTKTYHNGKKQVNSYLCSPVFVDASNYKTILIDSGYYTEDQLS